MHHTVSAPDQTARETLTPWAKHDLLSSIGTRLDEGYLYGRESPRLSTLRGPGLSLSGSTHLPPTKFIPFRGEVHYIWHPSPASAVRPTLAHYPCLYPRGRLNERPMVIVRKPIRPRLPGLDPRGVQHTNSTLVPFHHSRFVLTPSLRQRSIASHM